MNVTGSEQIGTVSGLDSFTVYNCSVHAVTKYGGPKSNYITVKTDEGGIVYDFDNSYICTYVCMYVHLTVCNRHHN